MPRRAADLLVDCLAAHGVDRVFCVPGESYLAALDALHDSNAIQTIVCRHESGAGFMGVGDAKLTGRPGVTFVSRGPGATNASIAVHVAEQDAVPLVLFVGQVPRAEIGRRSFQEVDYAKTFADMAKAVYMIHDAARVPETVARAFVEAQAPTPGPVVVVLPEDMLEDRVDTPVIEPLRVPQAGPAAVVDIEGIAALIAKAERPLVIAGGGALGTARGRRALLAASEAHALPVALSFKRQDYFPNMHPNYAGHLGFKIPKAAVERYLQADLMLAVGTRLGEATTQGYTLPASPVPRQPLVHVHDDPHQIGRNYTAAKALVADPVAVLEALAALPGKAPAARAQWIRTLNDPVAKAMPWTPPADGLLDMGPVVAALASQLAGDAILLTDAGNFSGWLHRHFPFSGAHVLVGCVGGAMGIGMPAAVAAALRFPGRQVINFLGDGGALMTGGELATAVQYGAKVKTFISNNGSYGTIRLHQEIAYKGRVHGTELTNPDFAKWAESFGVLGLTIAAIEEAPGVVEQALGHDGPVVVDVRTAVEHITPFATIAGLRG
ncbi:MAG TPA: thiamine pyrophosphate-dependent enzyme [Hyphomicrobiaceae bacterium]|jgi:acetolactate synthase-1/2/3 large subunit|nr:thiamine pyrophosphate-dependent enzyme [Hyphomicrobiaceae bacterium]